MGDPGQGLFLHQIFVPVKNSDFAQELQMLNSPRVLAAPGTGDCILAF